MKLHDVQALFHGVLTGEVTLQDPRLPEHFVSDARLPAPDRLHIYADMYLYRLVDALRAEFPMTAQALGEDAFFELARAYLRAHPSEHPDIAHAGRHLPAYLRGLDHRADLADLAALEQARSEAFLAADAEPRRWDELAALGPEMFAGTRLRFTPSVRTLQARFDLSALWTALQDEAPELPAPIESPAVVCVWKAGFEVFHARLSAMEAAGLSRARAGATLGEVCEAFAGAENPAAAAFEAIASWFNESWVATLLPPDA